MDPRLRSELSMGRLDHYHHIIRKMIFAYVAIAAIIGFGPEGISLVLVVLVIAAAYGVLAGKTALEDVDNLRNEMDAEFAQTSFAKGVKTRNFSGLIMASNVLLCLLGLMELIAVFL